MSIIYVSKEASEPMFLPTKVYSKISPGFVKPPFKSFIRTFARKSGSKISIAEVITRGKIASCVVTTFIVAFVTLFPI